jgi:hypothetical protein
VTRFSLSLILALAFLAAPGFAQAPPMASKERVDCVPAEQILVDVIKLKPDAEIRFLNQLQSWLFLSGMKELAKSRSSIPYDAITGLMLVWKPGEVGMGVAVLVNDQVCEAIQIPAELAMTIFKRRANA